MERKILKNKFFLYITEFFSGMSVMAVELGASRLLAPYFSSSQIVWTIIIGTIMIAMALGNIFGGRSADKNGNPDKLYRRILIAAVWIAAIPLLGKYVIVGIAGLLIISINQNFLIIAAFLACMIVFVFPLFLLGTVTPSLAKFSVDSLDDSGKVVGTLGAYNTIGSIIGTFLPTFVTIPSVGTSITFFIFGGILLLLCLIYFISVKKSAVRVAISSVIFILCMIFGHSTSFAFWEDDLTYEGESVYNYLQVAENDQSIWLSTNVLFGVQSITTKGDRLTGMYYDYALAAPLMAGVEEQDEAKILILGMGTGTYARQALRYFPNASMEGVEIDEKITELSHQYFDLPEEVKTVNYDGRAYLQALEGQYDVIMVDAYQDITIPFQMSSVEFFSQVRAHLKEGGVMVVNLNMKTDDPEGINVYLADTIGSVFSEIYMVDVPNSTNRILFASVEGGMKEVFEDARGSLTSDDMKRLMQKVSDGLFSYEAGNHILTDDKAPVEVLGMRVIDSLIMEEMQYYKEVYRQEGLQGLLNSL
ncbi:MAG: fused MFS/spermidine synthase [Lachnospiraceae bacterium]|nr:fused MFS/spermidine synthase [Lachnospiraceae bacterium]